MDKGNLGSPSGQSSDSGGNIQRHVTGADIEKAVAADLTQQKAVNKNRKFKFSFTWLWGGLLILENLAILIVVISIVSGNVAVLHKNPSSEAVPVYRVCGNDVVKQYNSIYGGEYAKYRSEIKKVADGIKKKQNYKEDPTCSYIVFQASLISYDLQTAKESLDSLKTLNANGINVDTRMNAIESLDQMETDYKSYVEAKNNGWRESGNG